MLSRYFGFQEDPFGATPDPRFLYLGENHREVLASLMYGFYCNRGFTVLIAQPGMGKTTLLFDFLEKIRESARTVFLFNTQCSSQQLLRSILIDLRLTPRLDPVEMHQQLNEALLQEARAGRRVVLCIDEAQNLSESALESVRLLTNFETSRTKLLQVVLAGQPQLSAMLDRPSMVQLRQRISTFCRLRPLNSGEIARYIEHRLSVAGYTGPPLFSEDALRAISNASEGIPRNINNLCFNSLSLCCSLKRKQADKAMVAEVIDDRSLSIDALVPPPPPIDNPAPAEGAARKQEPADRTRRSWISWMTIAAILILLLGLGGLGLELHKFTRPSPVVSYHPSSIPMPAPSPVPSAASSAKVIPVQPEPESSAASSAKVIPVQPEPESSAAGNAKVIPLQPEQESASMSITVQRNQTLQEISAQYLGSNEPETMHKIEALNPLLTNPDLILPGETIRLPLPHSLAAIRNSTPTSNQGANHEPQL